MSNGLEPVSGARRTLNRLSISVPLMSGRGMKLPWWLNFKTTPTPVRNYPNAPVNGSFEELVPSSRPAFCIRNFGRSDDRSVIARLIMTSGREGVFTAMASCQDYVFARTLPGGQRLVTHKASGMFNVATSTSV
jgi:hypothetical protein